jgi:drug/metabolite transporter (DMT)-like permease
MRFTTAGGSGALAFDLQLLLVALIWGSGFSVVQISLDAGLGPMELLLGPFLVACVLMGAACRRQLKGLNRKQIFHGVTAGVILFLAFLAQTWGIRYTTPSNNAFLTSTGVVMVPFLAWGCCLSARRRATLPPLY